MKTRSGLLVALSWIAALAGGCQGAPDSGLVEPPPGIGALPSPAKADVARLVDMLGPVHYGEAREGEFASDFQFDAYTLYAVEGAVISLYTTGDRQSESMDTTLFFFGPQTKTDGFGDQYLAWDNDSGWGQHARIDDFRIEREGVYLVVVGTPYAVGRGNYVLMAMCQTEDCDGDQPMILEEVELPAPLDDQVEQAAAYCQENVAELELDCIIDAARFGYARREQLPAPGIRRVVEELTAQYGYSEDCEFGGRVGEQEMQEVLEGLGAPDFVETSRTGLEDGPVEYGWGYCSNYLEEWDEQRVMHYYVLHFPDLRQLIAVSVGIWEDHPIE